MSDDWEHKLRVGPYEFEDVPASGEKETKQYREHIEPWLSALLQAEHLNLLIGSGLTTAVAKYIGSPVVNMARTKLNQEYGELVLSAAKRSAQANGRGETNVEDIIRVITGFIQGLAVLSGDEHGADNFVTQARELKKQWSEALETILLDFLRQVLDTEEGIRRGLDGDKQQAPEARRLLGSFLLTFASRTATRERLHVFTTNYDRLIEFGADLLGLRVIDRFVGGIEPVFRASRLGIDMHYNPPGIRGEPRYLEGVIRLSKLHGSIDWRQTQRKIIRSPMPFGVSHDHSEVPKSLSDGLMIYPNPAKDIETLEYPYAELFRDFACSVCQPNAVLVSYGYGFGDDHINRILRDMLTIPSTHLAIISFDDAGGRIPAFCNGVGRSEQITLLVGPHFGNLSTLVDHYLPKPAIDRTTWRMVELLNKRMPRVDVEEPDAQRDSEALF